MERNNKKNDSAANSQLSTVNSQLITPGYCFILAANFLLFFAFYLILPILPFYLTEVFNANNAAIGLILSSYTIAALCIRPFSGFLLDTFSRKPLYLIAYFVFVAIFAGYMLAGILSLFIMFRVVHGLAFGMVTVAGNTLVIDITPSSRRGEAIGYYGLMNNTAMSFGPMVGLFLHDVCPFETIFLCSLISGSLGFIMACLVKTPPKQQVEREPISLDRFILLKGIPAGISLLLLSIPYGMTTTYVAIYAKEIGISLNTGLFFTFMAVGMAVSRLFSGKQVDKGRITEIISLGFYLVCSCFFLLAACGKLMQVNAQFTTVLFFIIPLLLGLGFGTMFPAFNSLFVNLAPHNKRGTATSTYLTSWDVGIGIGLTLGGYIAQHISFDVTYLFGACLTVVSAVFFRVKVTPHFKKYKLR
ncbi:MFS transporter [Bacteroides sp. 519]|uniref:MFS transporter n=1 Tax=Bacteroides sp. 519 TaxID=2302937 RepID=UPI0013D1D0B6|nr:MFS transporter [Bacteroides sp. 519]NDV58495.1 MFS transporter [Bacteroides sp. 519]